MKTLLSLLLIFSVTACATKKHKKEIRVDAKESQIHDSEALGQKIRNLIDTSETLTVHQKRELESIFKANKKRAEDLTKESYKYRSILVKKLLTGNIVKKEIKFIKKEISRIESARLKNTFDTVEKITKLVSNQPHSAEFTDPLINFDRFSR